MRRTVCLLLFVLGLAFSVYPQSPSAWRDWDQKEAEKMLNDSAWSKKQVVSDVSELTANPGGRGSPLDPSIAGNRAERGSLNGEVHVNYFIRFFSAKPIRQAVARLMAMRNQPSAELDAQLNEFVERSFADYIIVAVNITSTDPRLGGPAQQALSSAAPGTLKNTTYLERRDGKRLFLSDYRIPGNDGLGAKFVFPRTLDGKPFLDADSGEVRFVAEVGTAVKINMRFKIKDMIYNGQLEY